MTKTQFLKNILKPFANHSRSLLPYVWSFISNFKTFSPQMQDELLNGILEIATEASRRGNHLIVYLYTNLVLNLSKDFQCPGGVNLYNWDSWISRRMDIIDKVSDILTGGGGGLNKPNR